MPVARHRRRVLAGTLKYSEAWLSVRRRQPGGTCARSSLVMVPSVRSFSCLLILTFFSGVESKVVVEIYRLIAASGHGADLQEIAQQIGLK